MMTAAQLVRKVKRLLQCDAARVVDFAHTRRKFLVVGWRRHSKGEGVNQAGEPQEFDYLEEHTVGTGDSLADLWRDACHYARLCREEAGRQAQALRFHQGRVATGLRWDGLC